MSRIDDRLIDAMPSPGDMHADQRAAAIARVQGRLAAIAASFAELVDQQRDEQPDTMADLGRYSRLYGKLTLDEVTEAVPAGPIKRSSGQPPVSGSRAPRLPIDVDLVDLAGRANAVSVMVPAYSPWPEDQTGHIPVPAVLGFWACVWARDLGHRLPAPNVADLCQWLDVRLEWAHDHHPGWNQMATALDSVARALYGTLSPRDRRSVPVSAPCPREGCDGALARREDGWVECGDGKCGRILSTTEYREWSRFVIARLANDTWGTSAKEIAIRYAKPMGTVHRLASQHAWRKTGKEHRPVMYDKAQVAVTMAKLAEKEAAAMAAA